MVQWQDRGYVGDSDEEEEFFDVDDPQENVVTRDGAKTLLQRSRNAQIDADQKNGSEDELHGLHDERDLLEDASSQRSNFVDAQSVQSQSNSVHALESNTPITSPTAEPIDQVSKQATSPKRADVFDIPSSPLTELDSQSPIQPARLTTPPNEPAPSSFPRVVVQIPHLDLTNITQGFLEEEEFAGDEVDAPATRAGRAFRRRTAIQLHPYLLESEQYRRALQSRGLKPIMVWNQESQAQPTTEGNESQPQDVQTGQSTPSSSFQASTPSPRHPVSNSPVFHLEHIPGRQEVGFSQVASAQPRSREAQPSGSHKKRKLSHAVDPAEEARRVLYANPMFQLSPSPEHSPSHQTTIHKKAQKRRPRLRIPKVTSPAALPTPPVTSSVRRNGRRIINSDDESSSDEGLLVNSATSPLPIGVRSPSQESSTHRATSPLQNEASLQGEKTESREQTALLRYRKKLKGILPASWLRIDHQPQKPTSKSDRAPGPTQVSPQRGTDRRGVARPTTKIHSDTPRRFDPPQTQTETVVEISDDEPTSPKSPTHLQHEIDENDDDDGMLIPVDIETPVPSRTFDIEEDNWVDPMLPSRSRPVKKSRRSRKRQTRLTDSFNNRQAPSATSGPRSHDKSKSHSSQRPKVMRKDGHPPRRVHNISLLDVLDGTPSTSQRPDFLRIAKRSALSKQGGGQQDLSTKQVYFRNRADAHDAEVMIKSWRNGTIRSKRKDIAFTREYKQQRPPLSERATNVQPADRYATVTNNTGITGDTPDEEPAASPSSVGYHHPTLNQRTLHLSSSPADHHPAQHDRADPKESARQVSGNLATKPRHNHAARPGQIEDLQTEDDERHPKAAFRRRLLDLDDVPLRIDRQNIATENPLLSRFLGQETVINGSDGSNTRPKASKLSNGTRNIHRASLKQRQGRAKNHKPRPRHVDTDDFSVYRSRSDENEVIDLYEGAPSPSTNAFEGLIPQGHFYPLTFGVHQLPRGVYFHRQSFIGSGELSSLLDLKDRDLDVNAGYVDFHFKNQSYKWGPWTEDVSIQLSSVLSCISSDVFSGTENSSSPLDDSELAVASALRAILRYFSTHLHFSDPVDREHCIRRSTESLSRFFKDLATLSPRSPRSPRSSGKQRIWMFSLGLWYALAQVQDQDKSASNLPDMLATANEMAEILRANLMMSCDGLFEALIRQDVDAVREKGIQDGDVLETWFAVIEILCQASSSGLDVWECFNHASQSRVSAESNDIQLYEAVWKDMFCILPLLHLHCSSKMSKLPAHGHESNWTLVKSLITRITNKYGIAGSLQSRVNCYLRALEGRCFELIKHWYWQKPEPALNCFFDFFAHRSLYLLNGEETANTSMLLEKINAGEPLKIHSSDHSFTLFLKMLRLSLLNMRQIYSDKKIRNITWRFVPNHGRVHRKEEDLRRDDLDALRNHHDLLSLLYASSPPEARPKTTLIENLVDLKSSHSEVCRLHIRTWSHLVRFQLATEEAASAIKPFSQWFDNIFRDLISQHKSARTEAESMYRTSNNGTVGAYSRKLVDKTIGSNERQVEALMSTALSCLKSTITDIANQSNLRALIEGINFKQIFRIAEQHHVRLGSIVAIAVETIQCYIRKSQQTAPISNKQQDSNEDSQDYGMWPSDNEDDEQDKASVDVNNVCDGLIADVNQLLSNCFGADTFENHDLLEKLTQCWVTLAHSQVRRKRHEWSYYLAMHSQGSWNRLRDTDNAKKFYPLYVAEIVKCDPDVLVENRHTVFEAWLASLLERESLLKYQHVLTSALLNHASNDPLMRNLPFESLASHQYNIRLDDLKVRRLSLISSIFNNMRQHVEDCLLSEYSAEANTYRKAYAQILGHAMNAMKKHYQALGTGSALKGAYVDFVHNIVEHLQQYTTEICPIDRFFTDSTAFPLPAKDPYYVIGRLRSYGLKPSDIRNQKKLAVFIQTVVERAISSGEHEYFTTQLVSAINTLHGREVGQQSLRRLLLEAIIPAYCDHLTSELGCFLALPLLASLRPILQQSLYHMDLTQAQSCESFSTLMICILQGIDHCTTATNMTYGPRLSALDLLLQALQASMPVLDFASRSTKSHCASLLSKILECEISTGLSTIDFDTAIQGPISADRSTMDQNQGQINQSTNTKQLQDLRHFTSRNLHDTISKNWSFDGRTHFSSHTSQRRSVEWAQPRQDRSRQVTLSSLRDQAERLLGILGPEMKGSSRTEWVDCLVV